MRLIDNDCKGWFRRAAKDRILRAQRTPKTIN
jgi:hypothetical protein